MTLRKELIDELLKESEGKDLFGKDGLISELTGRLVERALEAEMTEHLGYEKHSLAARQHPYGLTESGIANKKAPTPTNRDGR